LKKDEIQRHGNSLKHKNEEKENNVQPNNIKKRMKRALNLLTEEKTEYKVNAHNHIFR